MLALALNSSSIRASHLSGTSGCWPYDVSQYQFRLDLSRDSHWRGVDGVDGVGAGVNRETTLVGRHGSGANPRQRQRTKHHHHLHLDPWDNAARALQITLFNLLSLLFTLFAILPSLPSPCPHTVRKLSAAAAAANYSSAASGESPHLTYSVAAEPLLSLPSPPSLHNTHITHPPVTARATTHNPLAHLYTRLKHLLPTFSHPQQTSISLVRLPAFSTPKGLPKPPPPRQSPSSHNPHYNLSTQSLMARSSEPIETLQRPLGTADTATAPGTIVQPSETPTSPARSDKSSDSEGKPVRKQLQDTTLEPHVPDPTPGSDLTMGDATNGADAPGELSGSGSESGRGRLRRKRSREDFEDEEKPQGKKVQESHIRKKSRDLTSSDDQEGDVSIMSVDNTQDATVPTSRDATPEEEKTGKSDRKIISPKNKRTLEQTKSGEDITSGGGGNDAKDNEAAGVVREERDTKRQKDADDASADKNDYTAKVSTPRKIC